MIGDRIRLYFKWYIKTSFGLSVKLTDNLNDNEVQLVKRLIWFVRITNFAFLLLNISLIFTNIIKSVWVVLLLLVLSYIVLFGAFFLVFNKDNLSEELLIKIGN